LAVGAVIARVGPASTDGGAPASAPAQAVAPAGDSAPAAPAPDDTRAPQVRAPATAPPDTGGADDGGRVKASPLARRIARERGIDLRGLAGSGPGGRIVRADVLAPSAAVEGAGTPAPV